MKRIKQILKAIQNFLNMLWFKIRVIWDLVKLNLQQPRVFWNGLVNKIRNK